MELNDEQPTTDELSQAWTAAIECENIPGARAESRMKLIELRNRKTTWVGKYGLSQSAAIWRWNQRAGEIMPRTSESGATASQPRATGVLGGI